MNTANQVGIYNMAIAQCGSSMFVNQVDENSQQARVCNVFWESCRDQVLGRVDWGFAKSYTDLQLISMHTHGWRFTYTYPSDCLAAREIGKRKTTVAVNNFGYVGVVVEPLTFVRPAFPVPFETIENKDTGLAIATNMPDAVLRYTKRVAITLWSPAFVNCLSLLLASKIVGPLASNPKYAPQLGQAYEAALLDAAASSLNEQQKKPEPESELITTRG